MTLPPLEELKRLNGRRDLPWKVTESNAVTDRFGWSIFVDEETNDTAGTATPQDAQLVALAPPLLETVIKVHEAIDFLEKRWDTLNQDSSRVSGGHSEGFMDGIDYAIGTITRIARILEGEANE